MPDYDRSLDYAKSAAGPREIVPLVSCAQSTRGIGREEEERTLEKGGSPSLQKLVSIKLAGGMYEL